MLNGHAVSHLLDACRGRRVAVIGDPIVDQYLFGEPTRVSREAPVLILRHTGEEERPGGAANAAANAAALGGQVTLVGAVGDDAPGRRLAELLSARAVWAHLVPDAGRPTTVKTRVVAGGAYRMEQQVLRIDRYADQLVSGSVEADLVDRARAAVEWAEAVILSEYGGGTLTPAVIAAVLEVARRRGVPVVGDSRYRLRALRGVDAVTPNVPEAEQALGEPLRDPRALMEAGARLRQQLEVGLVVLTRGEQGMSLFFADGRLPLHLPAYRPREVYDVSGAGDTVVAALALGLSCGTRHTLHAALLADIAAGVVVGKRGVATVSAQEVREAARDWVPSAAGWVPEPTGGGCAGGSGEVAGNV